MFKDAARSHTGANDNKLAFHASQAPRELRVIVGGFVNSGVTSLTGPTRRIAGAIPTAFWPSSDVTPPSLHQSLERSPM